MPLNKSLLSASLLLSLSSFNAEASLTPYLSDGQSLVYSSVSNITWTGDGNLLGTMEAGNPDLVNTIISTIGSIADLPNIYDNPAYSRSHTLSSADFGTNGLVDWFGAQAYVSYLNTINYAGSNHWVLPSAGNNPQTGYGQTGSQFGQLFYNELGGTDANSIPNSPNFINELAYGYWLSTEEIQLYSNAWALNTGGGFQFNPRKTLQLYAWAVSPGQVAAVPIPGAAWLFGTGLVGLISFKQRRHTGNSVFSYSDD